MAKILEFNLENEVLPTEKKKLSQNFSPKNVLKTLAYFIIHQGIYILLTKEQKSRHQICVSTTYIHIFPYP